MEETSNHKSLQLVIFKIGNEEFGVNVLHIQEIKRMMEIIRVPKTPVFIKGVINLRGKIIPIVELRQKFDLPYKEPDKSSRIVVASLENQDVGFLVDSVLEVLTIFYDQIDTPPSFVAGISSDYIRGVIKLETRFLILLNLRNILLEHEKQKIVNINQETINQELQVCSSGGQEG